MKHSYSLFFVYLLSLISYCCVGQQLYSIPKQTIDPYKILGPQSSDKYNVPWTYTITPKTMKLDMDSFEISKLVTYGEYKQYLSVLKKDSSNKFYLSQMPDTLMCLPEVYKEYTTGNKYDDYPVMGIRWDAAMNYCRWKTIQSNKDSIKYIYRLPCESEWLDAFNYLNSAQIKNDLSQNYSDWLLNTFDEGAYDMVDEKNNVHGNNFDYIYLATKIDPPVLKRKRVIGDSYLFKMPSLADYDGICYHFNQGYRQVGFRCIKEIVDSKDIINRFGKSQSSMDIQLLKNWGLNYSKQ